MGLSASVIRLCCGFHRQRASPAHGLRSADKDVHASYEELHTWAGQERVSLG